MAAPGSRRVPFCFGRAYDGRRTHRPTLASERRSAVSIREMPHGLFRPPCLPARLDRRGARARRAARSVHVDRVGATKLGCRHRAAPAAGGQRPAHPDQGLVPRTAARGTGSACRQHVGRRPHDRHPRRVLALPGGRSRARAPLHAVAHRQPRPHAVRAVDVVDLSRTGRATFVVPGAVLHLRRRSRGVRVPADGRAQAPAAARPCIQARCARRQRRPGLLGPAGPAIRASQRRCLADRREHRGKVRPLRAGARQRQRDRAQARRRSAVSADLRHRLPLDPDLLHPG